MRIGVDISICAFNNAGSARHSQWLLGALQREAVAQQAEIVPLQLPPQLRATAANFRRKALVLFWELLYAPHLLGLLARSQRCDLLHATGLTPLANVGLPVVVTLHDMLPVLEPRYFTQVMGLRMRRRLMLMLRAANHVIASSHSTANDLARVVPLLPAEVSVVYPGSFLQERAAAPRRQKDAQQYVLAVGTLEPRKNLPTVLRAFHLLHAQYPDLALLLVGPQGWLASDLGAEVERLGLAGRVRTTGFVPDAELARLYAGATMLVYPSLYEGFGFPPLEAMSCGCPVITSNVSSLPEVVGNAGLLVNPHNVEQLARAMRLLLEQPRLVAQLRERGYNQATQFSWRRCASETLAIYRRVLQERGGVA